MRRHHLHESEVQGAVYRAGIVNPATPSPRATTARRQSSGRIRLQPPAAHPGALHRPSREAGTIAVTGIPSDPVARRTEIGYSFLQPQEKSAGLSTPSYPNVAGNETGCG